MSVVSLNTVRGTHPPFSLSREMWEQLESAFSRLGRDRGTRVVLLRGANGAFSAGADFDELLEVVREDQARQTDSGAHAYWRLVDRANSAVEDCPKPVIAVIERYALGAACALLVACDFRIAAAAARIGVPAVDKGLTLGLNDTRRLVASVGAAHAREILLTGAIYNADDAFRMGLINRVVRNPGSTATDDAVRPSSGHRAQSYSAALFAEAESLAARFVATHAPLAMQQAKLNIATVTRNPGFTGIDENSAPIAWAGSADILEGISAYLEHRRPTFKGE